MQIAPALNAPLLSFFADLSVQVGKPQEVGQTPQGLRRVIPIIGGTAAATAEPQACAPTR